MTKAIELADKLELEWKNNALDYDTALDSAAELRRLVAVEQDFKLSEEMNEQLREQNTLVDAACAKMEQELADLKAAMGDPVARVNDDGFVVETGLDIAPGVFLYAIKAAK